MSKKIDNIMELFIHDSYRKFNVREAARLAKSSPTTASNHLANAAKRGLLKKEKSRNLILFSADLESQSFRDMKIYSNVKKIRDSGIVELIENEVNFPEALVLFGSYAKGENKKDSDIDLFILSESKNKLDLEKFENILGAEIQIFLHSRKEFENMKIKNKELINNIINGIKLRGFLEVFK